MELQPNLPSSPRHISPPGKPQETMDTGVASWCCYNHYITYHVHNLWKNIANEYRIHRYHAYVYTQNYMHSIKIAGQSYEPNDVLPLSLRRSTPVNMQYIWWMCWKLLYSFAFVQSRMQRIGVRWYDDVSETFLIVLRWWSVGNTRHQNNGSNNNSCRYFKDAGRRSTNETYCMKAID